MRQLRMIYKVPRKMKVRWLIFLTNLDIYEVFIGAGYVHWQITSVYYVRLSRHLILRWTQVFLVVRETYESHEDASFCTCQFNKYLRRKNLCVFQHWLSDHINP